MFHPAFDFRPGSQMSWNNDLATNGLGSLLTQMSKSVSRRVDPKLSVSRLNVLLLDFLDASETGDGKLDRKSFGRQGRRPHPWRAREINNRDAPFGREHRQECERANHSAHLEEQRTANDLGRVGDTDWLPA